jgi:hypothetical protein
MNKIKANFKSVRPREKGKKGLILKKKKRKKSKKRKKKLKMKKKGAKKYEYMRSRTFTKDEKQDQKDNEKDDNPSLKSLYKAGDTSSISNNSNQDKCNKSSRVYINSEIKNTLLAQQKKMNFL